MNNKDRQDIIDRYKNRFDQHGTNVKALASGNEERQTIRFQCLSEIGNLDGCRILDFGCGLADYYQFLIKKNINIDYTGIDIVPDFIDHCQKIFPNQKFYCLDLEETTQFEKQEFDYAFCSQVFNHKYKHENNEQLADNIMKKLYSLVKQGVAVDFITSYVDYKEDRHFYFEPEKMFALAKKITKRVQLRHDYPLFEFCLYLYKDFKGWKRSK